MPPTDVITDRTDIALLTQSIRNPNRDHIIVLLTIPQNEFGPVVPPPELAKAAGADTRICVIRSGALTQEMERRLPHAHAFNGACRVYPPGTDPAQTKLLLPGAGPEELRRQLIEEIAKAHRIAEEMRRTPTAPAGTPEAQPSHRDAAEAGHGIRLVSTESEADWLAQHVLSPTRRMPVVVVSRAVGEPAAFVDTTTLADQLSGLAEVYEMPTGPVTWAFSGRLPEQTDIYGGASRVYPVDPGWQADPYQAPLLFAFPGDDARLRTDELISAALRFATAVTRAATPSVRRVEVEAELIGAVASRGLANIRSGGTGNATIWPELIAPGVPAERLFSEGMRVRGLLDLDSKRLDVTTEEIDLSARLATYQPGATVLTLVRAVERDLCVLALYPDVEEVVPAEEVVDDPADADLRALLSAGEVVAARIVRRGDTDDDWALSLLGIEHEPLPAPSILPGGPPWLVPPVPAAPAEEASEDAPAALPEAPAPERVQNLAADPTQVEALVRERDRLQDQLRRGEGRERRLKHELEQAKSARRRAEQATRALRKDVAAAGDQAREAINDHALFGDPEEQLRFEVDLAWARRFPASDKPNRPRRPWRIGPDFLQTLDAMQGVDRRIVVKVIVEVITGLVAETAGRELHQLRDGMGGNTAQRTRADGSKAWRVSLQSHTPSARRLHYWALPDGTIELSSVRLHDDFEP